MKQTAGHETTGANVSKDPSYKSPLTQYLVLYFLMVPSGRRLRRKTQVLGRMRVLASSVLTSIYVPRFAKSCISLLAAAIHSDKFAESLSASSKLSVSGSVDAAF